MFQKAMHMRRRYLQLYGSTRAKERLWDKEFSGGRWNRLSETSGDCLYPFLEKYGSGGSILDLGCGWGNTANEIAIETYTSYTGVDISNVSLERARQRVSAQSPARRVQFVRSDFISYEPSDLYDVILFRDSIYYVPLAKIKPMLQRYKRFLTGKGVFIVRICNDNGRHNKLIEMIESGFQLKENFRSKTPNAVVLAFR